MKNSYKCVLMRRKSGKRYYIITRMLDRSVEVVNRKGDLPTIMHYKLVRDQFNEPVIYEIDSKELTDEQKESYWLIEEQSQYKTSA